jgi:predicted DsbA family dithiol-disulfide isomerase
MLRIDFVSDINCPWCALGLAALDSAIAQLGDEIAVEIHCQPFELNPQLPAAGVGLVDYLHQKYGMSSEQIAQTHNTIRARGEALNFHFATRERLWNTFNAHRLLYWVDAEYSAGQQLQLKRALMQAYQGEGKNISDSSVLLEIIAQLQLDKNRAAEILASDIYSNEVRQAQQQWAQAGITSVPSVIINRRHLLQGAQAPETYAQALRELATTPS